VERDAGQGKLARLLKGARQPPIPVTLPGGVRVLMRSLSRADIQECLGGAIARFSSLGIPYDSPFLVDHLQDELLNQMLYRALRDPDDPERTAAGDASELRDHLSPPEQAALYDQYDAAFGDVDPDASTLTAMQWDQIADAVKKKDVKSLRRCDWSELVSYLLTSGNRPGS